MQGIGKQEMINRIIKLVGGEEPYRPWGHQNPIGAEQLARLQARRVFAKVSDERVDALLNTLRSAEPGPMLIIDPNPRDETPRVDLQRDETPVSTPAAELLHLGICTPACLLAYGSETSGCTCRCRGRYHGVLSAAQVPTCSTCHEQPPAGFRCLACGVETRR